MSKLLNKEEEEVEMEVFNEYKEIIYRGKFEEYLAMNNYDEELEDILNRVLYGHAVTWMNEDNKIFIIKKVLNDDN